MNIQNQPAGAVIFRFQDYLLNRPIRFTWINATPDQCLRTKLHNLRTRLVCERARAKASGDAATFRDVSSRGNGPIHREIRQAERELAELMRNRGSSKISQLREDLI